MAASCARRSSPPACSSPPRWSSTSPAAYGGALPLLRDDQPADALRGLDPVPAGRRLRRAAPRHRRGVDGHRSSCTPARTSSNWAWAGIHAGFVAAAGAANVLAWRLNEDTRKDGRRRSSARDRRGALPSADDAIVSFDPEGTLISWNPARRAGCTGVERERSLGRARRGRFVRDRSATAGRGRARPRRRRRAVRDRAAGTLPARTGPVSGAAVSPRPRSAGETVAVSAIVHDIGERKRHEAAILVQQALAHQALHDALTGLPNRALFDRPPRARARRARRAAATASPCCSSTSTASRSSTTASATRSATSCWSRSPQRLRACLRARATPSRGSAATSSRSCSRTSTTRPTAAPLAERDQRARSAMPFRARRPRGARQRQHRHRASAHGRRPAPTTLLRDADIAMYRAKAPARPRYARLRRRRCTPSARRAPARSRPTCAARSSATSCALHYQPIVDLGRRARSSASRRWCAGSIPSRGLVAARRVHPARRGDRPDRADRRWVLREACRPGAPPGRRAGAAATRSDRASTCRRASSQQPDLADDVAERRSPTPAWPPTASCSRSPRACSMQRRRGRRSRRLGRCKGSASGWRSTTSAPATPSLSYLERFPVDIAQDRPLVRGRARDAATTTAVLVRGDHHAGARARPASWSPRASRPRSRRPAARARLRARPGLRAGAPCRGGGGRRAGQPCSSGAIVSPASLSCSQ